MRKLVGFDRFKPMHAQYLLSFFKTTIKIIARVWYDFLGYHREDSIYYKGNTHSRETLQILPVTKHSSQGIDSHSSSNRMNNDQ